MTFETTAREFPGGILAQRIWVTIPAWASLTPEQREAVEAGAPYPILVADYEPEHLHVIDYLVEKALEEWQRSQG